jgi:anti-sigma regulatory factor (Ser/Thr protein kinase)
MDDIDDRSAESPPPLSITVTAADQLSAVRASVREWLRSTPAEQHADEILLASGEALANALEHGRSPVDLSLRWSSPGLLELAVRDSGAWRVSADVTSRGLGIPIMTALTDSLTFQTTDGTTVRLSRRFPS